MQKTHALRAIEGFTPRDYSSIRPLCSNSNKVVLLFFASALPGVVALLPQALSAGGKRCKNTGEMYESGYFYLHGNEAVDKYRRRRRKKHTEMIKNIPKYNNHTGELMMNQFSAK